MITLKEFDMDFLMCRYDERSNVRVRVVVAVVVVILVIYLASCCLPGFFFVIFFFVFWEVQVVLGD